MVQDSIVFAFKAEFESSDKHALIDLSSSKSNDYSQFTNKSSFQTD